MKRGVLLLALGTAVVSAVAAAAFVGLDRTLECDSIEPSRGTADR